MSEPLRAPGPGDGTDTGEGVEFEDCVRSADRGCCSWSSDSVDVLPLDSVSRSAGAGSF